MDRSPCGLGKKRVACAEHTMIRACSLITDDSLGSATLLGNHPAVLSNLTPR